MFCQSTTQDRRRLTGETRSEPCARRADSLLFCIHTQLRQPYSFLRAASRQPGVRHSTSPRAPLIWCTSDRLALSRATHPSRMDWGQGASAPKSKLKAVFFDLDGTCVNSDHIHYETYRDTILDLVPTFNGGTPITRAFYDTAMSGRQNPELVASILPNMPVAERTNLWQTKEARYEEVIMQGVPPVDGLLDLLAFCKETGLITYIVTNAPKGSCAKTMKSIGISDHFGTRVVVAEECERAKPDPAPYLKALKLADVTSGEAIVFEDSPSGIESATAAGIFTIGVRSTQTDEALRAAGSCFTIPNYTSPDLRRALTTWIG